MEFRKKSKEIKNKLFYTEISEIITDTHHAVFIYYGIFTRYAGNNVLIYRVAHIKQKRWTGTCEINLKIFVAIYGMKQFDFSLNIRTEDR